MLLLFLMGIIADIFLPLALAFIMFSLGISLTINDFLKIAKQPKDFFVGAVSQIIILPFVALLLVILWPLSPELAIGVMLIAAAPGGATSNIITSFAKGDVALSVSLTAVMSLLCVITIPFVIFFSLNILTDNSSEVSISILNIAFQMFLIVTIPVIMGILIRKYFSNLAISFELISKKISTILFVMVLIGAILSEKNNISLYFSKAGLITLSLNLLMMLIAYYISKIFIKGIAQQKSLIVEVGLQNGTLAIVVATSVFGGGIYLIPAATYSLIMFVTSLIYVFFARKII